MTPLFIDLETRSTCDLKEAGGWNYAQHPTTKLLTCSWSPEPDVYYLWLPTVDEWDLSYLQPPSDDEIAVHLPDVRLLYGPDVPQELLELTDRTWIAHNAMTFDKHVWEALYPHVRPVAWDDTYPRALTVGLPGGLNAIGKVLWGEGKYQEESQLVKKAFRAESVDDADPRNVPVAVLVQVGRYNVQDVRLLRWTWEEIQKGPSIPATEEQVLQAHYTINQRGAKVDTHLLGALSKLSTDCRTHALSEISRLTKGKLSTQKCLNSRTKVFAWLKTIGVNPGPSLRKEIIQRYIEKNTRDEDEEEDTDAPDDDAEVSTKGLALGLKVLELRMSAMKITDSKLLAAQKAVDTWSRIRFLFAYWGAHCVSGETEVLTPDGWKRIDEWEGGPIAQWSLDGNIRFAPATANQFDNAEPMVQLDSPYAAGLFTAGHRVPTYNTVNKFVERAAGDMLEVGQHTLPISGVLRGSGAISADQMRLLVAIQADGHWVLDTAQGRGLQFTLRKLRKLQRIQDLLNTVGIPYRVQEFPSCPGQYRVSVRWADRPEWLKPEYKVFGPWLLDSTEEAREAFVEELKFWDGSAAKVHGNDSYYSYEPINLEWAATLCHLTGRAMLPGKKRGSIRRTSTTQIRSKGAWTPADPIAKVYCPTTQTGYWVYRYRGKIGITGNTGRWAGRRLQVHNLPKPKEGVPVWDLLHLFEERKALPYEDVRALLPLDDPLYRFLSVDDAASALIRSVFVGNPLATADLANIECRVLAWLAGEDWLLQTFWTGADPYMAMAERVFGKKETWQQFPDPKNPGKFLPIKKHPYRQAGKVIELGSGFRLGEVRLAMYFVQNGVDIDDIGSSPRVCTHAYRDSHPAICGEPAGEYKGRKYYRGGFWDQLNDAALAVVATRVPQVVGKLTFEMHGPHMTILLPSGRRLVYRNARTAMVTPSYAKGTGKKILAVQFLSQRFGWKDLHGGVLSENCTQAVARDFLAHAIVQLEEQGMPVVLHVHDEAGSETEDLERFMIALTTPPPWAPDFPLEAEGNLAKRYAKSPPPGVKEVVYRNGRMV